MSYEVQGRQYHQWFGHGTRADADGGERELTPAELARVIAAGAGVSLTGATRAAYEGWLAKGGLEKLEAAVPVWADGSGLEAGRFRSLLVGPGLGAAGAAALQDVGRLVRGARDVGDLQAASARLAAAVEAGGAEWRHGLSYARDEAVYAAAQGLVPTGGALGEGGTFVLASAPTSPAGAAASSSHPELEAAKRLAELLSRMGPWGKIIGGVIGAGVGAYLYFKGGKDEVPPSTPGGLPNVMESKPPRDAYDKDGAKAPGKPTEAEGFRDPRTGEDWVRAPEGGGYGWLDADGNVWVPTGKGSLAHGGPHWDVQGKRNGSGVSVYPGGKRRPSS